MQRLAGVDIRPALPRSDIGKILKQKLHAAYWTLASMGTERHKWTTIFPDGLWW